MKEIVKNFEYMYDFENNSGLYKYCFKDTKVPMWMYIRSYFIRDIANKKLTKQNRKSREYRNKINKGRVNKYIFKNPFFSQQKDILFALWNYSTLKIHENGLVYDQLINQYLQMFPKNTTTLMNGSVANKYELRCSHPDWKIDDCFIEILNSMRYMTKKSDVCPEDKSNIKRFINYLDLNCPLKLDNNLRREVIWRLEEFAKNAKYMIKIYEVYLAIVKPKVAIICCASYPDIIRTPLILACKNRGVVTAELQHGLISRYHTFYQYSDIILNNYKYKGILPEYFLTFGEYWDNKIKIPQKHGVIGYAKPVIMETDGEENILFCADVDFEKYILFLDKFMPELDKNIKLFFRFHPLDSTKKQRDMFQKYVRYDNFVLANELELSVYLKNCRYVIVDGSTVCYEALFMGRIVFSFDSEQSSLSELDKLTDIYLFNNVNDFMKIWSIRGTLNSKYHKEFFNLNYRENYITFLKKCGVNTNIQ